MSRSVNPDDWQVNCWSIFAISVIAVALVVAHYSIGLP